MTGPHPAVAATRLAVRRSARGGNITGTAGTVFVACSGGADSLALAAAAAFELPKVGLRVGAVVVDHQLQDGSADVACAAAATCRELGIDSIEVARVDVEVNTGDGPESQARDARHAAFAEVLRSRPGSTLLLGHTRNDQAETVLLRLARGSGTRAIAGMADSTRTRSGLLLRPFLNDITRAQTRAACEAQGLSWWDDPHNADPRFTRVRVRRALQSLQQDLGPGLVQGLARSATLARQDADYLDGLAVLRAAEMGGSPWRVSAFEQLPAALRTRVWRLLMTSSGASSSDVGAGHVASLDTLVTAWRGQGPVDIPGGLRVSRTRELVVLDRSPVQ